MLVCFKIFDLFFNLLLEVIIVVFFDKCVVKIICLIFDKFRLLIIVLVLFNVMVSGKLYFVIFIIVNGICGLLVVFVKINNVLFCGCELVSVGFKLIVMLILLFEVLVIFVFVICLLFKWVLILVICFVIML